MRAVGIVKIGGTPVPGANIAATDANGNPIRKSNGGFVGVVSDINGQFSIETSAPNIAISYVGYKSIILPTIDLVNHSEIHLEEATNLLREFTITAPKKKTAAMFFGFLAASALAITLYFNTQLKSRQKFNVA